VQTFLDATEGGFEVDGGYGGGAHGRAGWRRAIVGQGRSVGWIFSGAAGPVPPGRWRAVCRRWPRH
jgi:hypothetical protein